jgi:pantoate--beta-alanine ligase
MEIIAQPREMQQRAEQYRRQERVISFVPTMGYLHEGHLSLMREARKQGDVLVISIFVNPTQFGPGEDYVQYPRDMERDLALIKDVGVDICFNPSAKEMYPDGFQTTVEVHHVTRNLCGVSRPGHFRGVTTVVAKLFNIVKPHVAFFGQKDYQQLIATQRMVEDLNMDIEVIGLPTVREADGLAMSSRNSYLSPAQRALAPSLYRSLLKGKELFSRGERNAATILNTVCSMIERETAATIDYVKLCDARTIQDIDTVIGDAVIAVAARIGATRLIDNIILKEE